MSAEDTAIKAMESIVLHAMNGLYNKVEEIRQSQENLDRKMYDVQQHLQAHRQAILELTQEVKRIANLMPSDTTLALTGPLLELQNDSRRRRENSALRRARQPNETGY